MKTKKQNNFLFIHLSPNEDIYMQLEKACKKHKVQTAVVISGIGQLKNFKLGYFKQKNDYTPQEFKNPYELLNLSGNIALINKNYEFHLHACLGDKNKNVIGGHLIKGIVEVTGEIVLLLTKIKLNRYTSKKTGLRTLDLNNN